MAENYLYLLKKMDSIDTINPGGVYESHMYRMKVIDSLRFDTVKPKIMAIIKAIIMAKTLFAKISISPSPILILL